MKKLKDNKKLKIFLIIFGILLLIFIIVNIVWLIYNNKYKTYLDKTPYNKAAQTYSYLDDNNNSISATDPKYLKFINNLAVSDEDDNSLIIWINYNGIEYGATVKTSDDCEYQFLLDENGNLVKNKDSCENDEKILKQYRKEIDDLYECADKQWDLK